MFNRKDAFLSQREIRSLVKTLPKDDHDQILRSVARQCLLTVTCANAMLGTHNPKISAARQEINIIQSDPLDNHSFEIIREGLTEACDLLSNYNDETLAGAFKMARNLSQFRTPLSLIRETLDIT